MYQDYMNNINKQKYGFNEEIDLNKPKQIKNEDLINRLNHLKNDLTIKIKEIEDIIKIIKD